MKHIDLELENRSLRRQFMQMGLDSRKVCPSLIGETGRENHLLNRLLDWVVSYKKTRSRGQMEINGYEFPPIKPECDPDTDWLLFENWVNGKPLTFSLGDISEFFRFKDLDKVSDKDVNSELDLIYELLEKRSIHITLQDNLPPKLEYEYLRDELKDDEYQYLAPGTIVNITGCTGYCPGCAQRPWCEQGQYKTDDDIDAGKMVVPAIVMKYFNGNLPKIEQLIDYDFDE